MNYVLQQHLADKTGICKTKTIRNQITGNKFHEIFDSENWHNQPRHLEEHISRNDQVAYLSPSRDMIGLALYSPDVPSVDAHMWHFGSVTIDVSICLWVSVWLIPKT